MFLAESIRAVDVSIQCVAQLTVAFRLPDITVRPKLVFICHTLMLL